MNAYFHPAARETEAGSFTPGYKTQSERRKSYRKLLIPIPVFNPLPRKHMKDAFTHKMKLPATTKSSTKPSVSLIIRQLISNHPKQIHSLRAPSNTVLAGKLDGGT